VTLFLDLGGTIRARSSAETLAMLRPLRPQRNLTEEVVDQLASEIRSGRLSPGWKSVTSPLGQLGTMRPRS